MAHVQRPGSDGYTVAAKGAPEAIAELCHFNPTRRERLEMTAIHVRP
jgi:hypothetical protein